MIENLSKKGKLFSLYHFDFQNDTKERLSENFAKCEHFSWNLTNFRSLIANLSYFVRKNHSVRIVGFYENLLFVQSDFGAVENFTFVKFFVQSDFWGSLCTKLGRPKRSVRLGGGRWKFFTSGLLGGALYLGARGGGLGDSKVTQFSSRPPQSGTRAETLFHRARGPWPLARGVIHPEGVTSLDPRSILCIIFGPEGRDCVSFLKWYRANRSVSF